MKVKLFATIALVVIPTLAYAAGGGGGAEERAAARRAAQARAEATAHPARAMATMAAPTMAVGRVAQPALTAARVTALTVALTAQQAAAGRGRRRGGS